MFPYEDFEAPLGEGERGRPLQATPDSLDEWKSLIIQDKVD